MPRRLIDEAFVDRCATALGREMVCPMGSGQFGSVGLLDDGSVLKVSVSPFEAAVALALMEEAALGTPVPAFPAVARVLSADMDGDRVFVIVREEIGDVFEDPGPDDEPAVGQWLATRRALALSWNENAVWLRRGICDDADPEFRSHAVFQSLDWLEKRSGCRLADLKEENFGRRDDGQLVIRDFGCAQDVFGSFVDGMLSALPELETNPGPCPR